MAKWLLNNISLKIGAIIIAILLWFHVVTEKVIYETVEAPLKFQNLPEDLVIIKSSPEEITFQIKTKIKQLILLNLFGHPFVKVDLSKVVTGKNTIKPSKDWVNLPSWRPLDVTGIIQPKKIILETEKRDEKKVPVRAVIKGSPHEGYFIKNITVKPESIVLIGGKKSLKKIKEVETDTVDITEEQRALSVEKDLIVPEGGFLSKTDRVQMSITFEKCVTKTLHGVKVILKARGDYIVYPETIDVTVSGPPNLLKELTALDIKAYVDVRGEQEKKIPYFSLPEGIAFKSSKPRKVEVKPKNEEH